MKETVAAILMQSRWQYDSETFQRREPSRVAKRHSFAVDGSSHRHQQARMLRDYIQLPLPVRILCLGSLINRAGSFVLVFLTIYASEQMGFGVTFATACMGVLGLGSTVGAMLGGHLADQIGRRRVMLTALFGGAGLLVVIGSLDNRWLFMVTVGLFAMVSDMYRPAASAMIADLVTIDRRPHAFALMYISINLGFAVAPPIGGLLAEHSFKWLFWGDALTMSLYGLIILTKIRETLPAPDDQSEGEESSPATASLSEASRRVAGDVPFLLFCLSSLLMAIVFMQGMSTLPIYIRQSGFSNFQFGLLMSINGGLIFLLQLPMTHWLSRFNPMAIVLLGGILISIGFGLNAFSSGLLFLALTICIWTLGEILQAPFKQAIVTNMAPADLRARYLGLFSMCYASALTIGAPIGGEVLNRFGARPLWICTFAVAMVAVIVYISIYRSITDRSTVDASI